MEYRLAKARVAGSNPVSCSQRDRKKSHPMDGSFFYVQALPGSNGSNVSAPVVAGERPPDVLRRLVLSKKCEKEEISDGYLLFFSHVRVWSGLNGSKSWLRSVHRRRHHVRLKIIYFFRKKQATSDFCAIMLYYEKVRCIKRGE